MPSLGGRSPAFATPGNFLQSFCCVIFVAKERPEVLLHLKLGLCGILENSIFYCSHIIHLMVLP